MPLENLLIHVVPLQVSFSGDAAVITCNDTRAEVVNDELVFTFTNPPALPVVTQRVRFVVEDPTDSAEYDYYLNMLSAPPGERLDAWRRSGDVSSSLEMGAGHDFEVVAIVYGIPKANPTTPVKIAHGRRRFKIRNPGAPGDRNMFG
ncbi:MAG: hypothetical protein JNL82_38215 [Myxococcales bacterium]|nr:hypothetical protein [Myxococcales bacterium]